MNNLKPNLEKINLFNLGQYKLHSGDESDWKIDCDALSEKDLECLAYLVSKKFIFSEAHGVPRGGLLFAEKLKRYATGNPKDYSLIVDDVLTSGKSMEDFAIQTNKKYKGIVIFARGICPEWITPIFQTII